MTEKSKPCMRKRIWASSKPALKTDALMYRFKEPLNVPKAIPYVLKADADRLAKALRACKIRVPVDMDPPYEDGNLAAWKEAEAALAAYEGGGS